MNAKAHVKDISQIVWGAVWLSGRSPLIVIEREPEFDPQPKKKGYTAKSYIRALEKGLIQHYRPGLVFQ
jgi:hypothetical protein